MSDSLREALKAARIQLITLGGDPRPHLRDGDSIQAAVLGDIDAALSAPQADAEAVAYVPLSKRPQDAGEPIWRETRPYGSQNPWTGYECLNLYTAPPSQSAEMRKALERIVSLEEQQPGLKALVSEMRATARQALSRAGDGKESEGGEDPFVHGAEDEAYALGRRDGYESALQDIDLATGGDGEFKGSTIPGETVDVPAMKARIIARVQSSSDPTPPDRRDEIMRANRLADEYERGTEKARASEYAEFCAEFFANRKTIIDALRSYHVALQRGGA